MYYIIAVKDKELKRITATESKVFAEKMLRTDEDFVMETKIFTDKNKCAEFLYLNCNDSLCCKNIKSCLAIINDTEQVCKFGLKK